MKIDVTEPGFIHLLAPNHTHTHTVLLCECVCVYVGGLVRGYPLVNVTCLSATLLLVNCRDYCCHNVAIKQEEREKGEGLMELEMDVRRLHGSGKCIKVVIHSDPSSTLCVITARPH